MAELSIGFESFLGRFALLLFSRWAAVLTGEVQLVDLLGLGCDSCAFNVIPARSSTLVLVGALDPIAVWNILAAYALVFFFVLVLLGLLLGFLLSLASLFFFFLKLIDSFSRILLFLVIEYNSFQVEGVEEGALGEGGNLFGIDGAYLVGVVSELYHFVIFGDICNFRMRIDDDLTRTISTSKNSFSSVMVVIELLIFSKSSLQAGLALMSLSTSSRCWGATDMPNLRRARCSMLVVPLICLQSIQNNYYLNQQQKYCRILDVEGLEMVQVRPTVVFWIYFLYITWEFMYKKESDEDYVAQDQGSANEAKNKKGRKGNIRLNKKEMIQTSIKTFLPEGVTLSKMQPLTSDQYQKLVEINDAEEFSLNYKTLIAKVVKVIDGDTFKAVVWLHATPTKFTFRIGGLDTPETRKGEAKQFGKKVKQIVGSLIDKKIVKIEAGDFDKYGRILARVFILSEGKELCVNDFLLENELGKSYAGKTKVEFTSEDEEQFLKSYKAKIWPKTAHYPRLQS